MDPNRCYQLLLESFNDGRIADARSYASLLNDWLEGGGFYPEGPDAITIDKMVHQLLRTIDSESLAFPFTSLCCFDCDAGSHLASLQQAMGEGWTEIRADRQIRVSTHLGFCLNCGSGSPSRD